MSFVRANLRVCPHCGETAMEHDYCPGCGTHLAALAELPTRAEWEAPATQRDRDMESRTGADSSTVPASAPAAATTANLPTPWLASSASLRPLLHPNEASRLALALIASVLFLIVLVVVLIGAHEAGKLGALVVVFVVTASAIWVGLYVSRAHRLGRCLRVTHESLPDLQSVLDEVTGVLGYARKVDVYVSSEETLPITTINYLGTRVIVLEGDLVGEMLANGKRSQLVFLLGREVGALKARFARLDLLIVLLNVVNAAQLMGPFLRPYYRATTYSGDQIGLACCGDLEAALDATRRLLVGSKLSSVVTAGAIVPQASMVRGQLLPRWAQLFLDKPHVTNRYVNLLCFGRYHDPAAWEKIARTMTATEASEFEAVWVKSAFRRRETRLAGARY